MTVKWGPVTAQHLLCKPASRRYNQRDRVDGERINYVDMNQASLCHE